MNITLQTFSKTNFPIRGEYSFQGTPLGKLLVVSFEKSIGYIAFVISEKSALQELQDRFPKTTFHKKETSVQKQITQYVKHPEKRNTQAVTILVAGSPFQLKVWQALLKIPFGKTVFYSDVAKSLKQVSAVRAAASAVAKNPVAILIPCHRVLPRSGGVGNYHWGSKYKSDLLMWETLNMQKGK